MIRRVRYRLARGCFWLGFKLDSSAWPRHKPDLPSKTDGKVRRVRQVSRVPRINE